jgi:putative toxin-antitoxin system antitoxin component (TIGR02293 family)
VALLGELLDDLLESEIIDTADVARVAHTTPRSVARWTAAKSRPRRENEDRLLELRAVVDQVRLVLRDEAARLWLRSPNPDLDWQKPIDVIAEGDYRRVIAAILAIGEGVTA